MCGPDLLCYEGDSLDGVQLCGARSVDGGAAANPTDADPGAPDALPSGPCDIVPQSGCGNGACDLLPPNPGGSCRVATPSGREETECSALEDCAAGYNCFDSACRRWCESAGDCGEGTCGFGTGLPEAFCSSTCDPVDNSGCPAGWGCREVVSEFGFGIAWCTEAGALGQGASCSEDEQCLAGFSCADVGGGGKVCLRNCSPADDPDCTGLANVSCRLPDTPLTIGGKQFGACL